MPRGRNSNAIKYFSLIERLRLYFANDIVDLEDIDKGYLDKWVFDCSDRRPYHREMVRITKIILRRWRCRRKLRFEVGKMSSDATKITKGRWRNRHFMQWINIIWVWRNSLCLLCFIFGKEGFTLPKFAEVCKLSVGDRLRDRHHAAHRRRDRPPRWRAARGSVHLRAPLPRHLRRPHARGLLPTFFLIFIPTFG